MFALEDQLHQFKTMYRSSPQWLKSTVGWLYSRLPRSIRYGADLKRIQDLLDDSQWWSKEQLKTYQWNRLNALLEHAYNQVPYYRRTWSEAGVSPADIQSMADMYKLPLLTKDQITEYKHELIAENYRNRLLKTNTGGSTGNPLELYWERGRTRTAERAFMWRQWRWAGFEYGDRTAVLRGQTVRETIHYDPIDQHLFLSSFELNDHTAPQYIAELRRFKPKSIQAYPASITVLANYMKCHGEPPLEGLKVVLAGSENLYPAQRKLIEEVFHCRVYSWYGHGEVTTLAGGCDYSEHYHVYSEYGFTELVDPEGNVLNWEQGVKGEIVGTGFNNWAMPLIRYRTADIAVVGPPTCKCGRNYPLWERIEGRKQEYVVARDGSLIPLTALIFGQHYNAFAKIKRLQVVQERPGEMLIRLIVNEAWSQADEVELHAEMSKVLDNDWLLNFDYVMSIDFTTAGKHRFVVQRIPLDNIWSGEQFPATSDNTQ